MRKSVIKFIMVSIVCLILGYGYTRWFRGAILDLLSIMLILLLGFYSYSYNPNESLGRLGRLKKAVVLFLVAVMGFIQGIDQLAIVCFGFHVDEIIGDAIAIILATNNSEVFAFIKNFQSFGFVFALLSSLVVVLYAASFNVQCNCSVNEKLKRFSFPAIICLTLALITTPNFPVKKLLLEIPDQVNNIINVEKYAEAKKKFFWNAKSLVDQKSTVIIVLGETTRGDHMSINGYNRETTPLLAKEKIVTFDNAISNSMHTLGATPYMLTRKPVSNEWIYKVYPEKSVISAFKEAGYSTYYISYLNNVHVGDNEINQIVNEADHYIKRPNEDGQCMQDSNGLPIIKNILENDKSEKKLIVYKLLGSHYHFQDDYPKQFDYFSPSFKTENFNGPDIGKKDIFINTYDNSILHTDYVVATIISYLKDETGEASLSLISDHGTSLYEDNKTVYTSSKKANYNIAYLFWLNDDVEKRIGDADMRVFEDNVHKPVDQTTFIDTVLKVSGIHSDKNRGLSLFENISDKDNRKILTGNKIIFYNELNE